jgi:archaellum component FlaF (FlaF/FlaG flagellin family)
MKLRRYLLFSLTFMLIATTLTSCAIGILLFHRDSKTTTIYKSSDSKTNYFIVNATTLSNCGCTHLNIDNYKNGKKDFHIFYNGTVAHKTIYKFDSIINKNNTLRLVATSNNYTIPFDSIDFEVYNQIDYIAIHKPKGIVYQINMTKFKGYIHDPYFQ